jgi:hypothetical protein
MRYYDQNTEENLTALVGQTVTAIDREGGDEVLMRLHLADGSTMAFIHQQDCCESVSLDDVEGSDEDIIGSPITLAEEVSETPEEPADPSDKEYGTFTWTFYRLATVKGYMTIKFYGSSNGYYSESVDFVREPQQP